MPRKGINIHKRKDGRWEGRYKIGVSENGKTKYHSVYGKTYGEVKEKMRLLLVSNFSPSTTQNTEKNLKEILELWISGNRLHLKDATAYKYDYLMEKHIIPELGNIKISAISATLVNSFLERKMKSGRLDNKGGLSSAYVKTMMFVIQSALQFAVDEGYREPIKSKINKPAQKKEEMVLLSKNEQRCLEEYASGKLDETALGILISLHTGLRIGEVCALTWDDIDLVNRILHVRHTVARVKCDSSETGANTCLILDSPKTTASKRDIPISSSLLQYLTKMKTKAKSAYVVSDKSGFLSPRTYDYRYHQALKQCGIANTTITPCGIHLRPDV